MVTYRLERDLSSGRIHKRYADEYGAFRLTDERCQRDQSGAYEIREGGFVDAEAGTLCGFDFPEVQGLLEDASGS